MIANFILGYVLPFMILVLAGLVSGFLLKNFRDERVIKWVGIAVRAAEQIYKESGMGKEKFAYVVDWISKKFKISEADLKNLIENAVFEINSEKNKEQKG